MNITFLYVSQVFQKEHSARKTLYEADKNILMWFTRVHIAFTHESDEKSIMHGDSLLTIYTWYNILIF